MEKKSWWKEHTEMFAIIGTVLTCFIVTLVWIDGKFDKINDRFDKVNDRFTQVDIRINQVEKDIAYLRTDMAIMKTVLQMKNIMPNEIAKCEKKGE